MPTLALYYPPKEKRWSLEVPGNRFLIGRSREAEVCLPHPSVSKKHVLVEKKGDRFVYRDLGSRNGVFLNGFRVDKGPLDDGDEMRVGVLLVTFFSRKPPVQEPKPGPATEASLPAEAVPVAPADREDVPPSFGELEAELAEDRLGFSGSSTIHVPLDPETLQLALDAAPAPAGPPAPRGTSAARKSRQLSPTAVGLGAAGCVLLGIILGYLAGTSELVRGKGSGAGKSQQSAESGLPRDSVLAPTAAKGLADSGPLGTRAALENPETFRRLCVRLYLDLVGRPPLRKELASLASLPAEKLWYEISSKAPPAQDLPPERLGEVFERLLGRKPIAEEHAKLLEAARGDPAHYAFEVGTSAEYASPWRRRKRTEQLLARSLIVDLTGAIPGKQLEQKTIDALRLAREDLASIAKALIESNDAAALAPQKQETPEGWARDAYARLLLRLPNDEELRSAAAAARKDGGAWRQVLLGLASGPEYSRY